MRLDRNSILWATTKAIVVAVTVLLAIAREPAVSKADPIDIVMWNNPVSESYTKFWKNYVDEFTKSHPDIHINYEEFDTETMKTKVRAALLAGTEPDIWFFNPGEFTTINHRQGKIRGLNDILPVSDYTKGGRSACGDGDEMICIPLYLAPSGFYYNKALFAKAGVDPSSWSDPGRPTLTEFNAAVDRLLAANIQPIAMANSAKWPFMFFYWAAQNRYGGTKALSDAIFGQNGGSFKDQSFVKAGHFLQDLVKRSAFGTGFNGMAESEIYSQFSQGNAAMIYMGPWAVSITGEQAPSGFEYDLFDFPSIEGGDPDSQGDMMAGVDALFVSSSTKHPKEVGEFLSGFSSPGIARQFMIETDSISTINGVLEDVVKSGKANAKIARLAEQLAKAKHTYQWWDWALPPAPAEEMLNLSQPLGELSVTPEEAAARIEKAARP
ncbi:extracellular solute-binding protein [Nordella sp. HKS 07]|uniref:extracellular solute-binding protein n=1 Tax=Nordella sp. HKS 07 TaxID=2712222 RepID=UPI0013E17059|nr:extracellular solute-binding protein [Nordella sp. HKS 07]QIG46598.1 extracellular solute-binding protein [Nordella sp. HKS 07]